MYIKKSYCCQRGIRLCYNRRSAFLADLNLWRQLCREMHRPTLQDKWSFMHCVQNDNSGVTKRITSGTLKSRSDCSTGAWADLVPDKRSAQLCYCQEYATVRCKLMSFACHCHRYVTVMPMLLSCVCYWHMYVTILCMSLWSVCYCHVCVMVMCMLLPGVCYYQEYVTVIYKLLSCVC